MKTILILIACYALFVEGNSLSGSEISARCHCDLTKEFCDFGCCCDLDCTAPITAACYNEKSKQYCPKTEFFYSIKGTVNAQNVCYYYNTTSTLIDEKTLSNAQRTEYINMNKQISPVASTLNTGYTGYKLSTILTIGDKSQFSFISSTGDCLTSAGTQKFSFRFGQNIKITCKSTSTINPLLFSQILGKSISKYYNVTSNNIALPSISETVMELKVNFIIGTYGSQGMKYVDKIKYSFMTGVGTTKTLSFNFIEAVNIQKQETSASFFPQIPKDIFYPIHMMS